MTAPLTHRLIPGATASKVTIKGRVFDPAAGAQDIAEFDAVHLQANGWMFLAPSGPTTQRPNSAVGLYPMLPGVRFWDTTISKMVMYDGKQWRNEAGTVA